MTQLIVVFWFFLRFQHVFDQRVKQEDIFEMTAKPVIDRWGVVSYSLQEKKVCV